MKEESKKEPEKEPGKGRVDATYSFSSVAKERVDRGESAFPHETAPYDKAGIGISRSEKLALPIQDIPLSDIVTVQKTVSPVKVEHFLTGGSSGPAVGEPMAVGSKFLNLGPWGVRTPDGKVYLEDGNTRGSAAAIRGDKSMPLKIVDVDSSGKWVGKATNKEN